MPSGVHGRTPAGLLFGRAEELALVSGFLAGAAAGGGSLLIAGEPGAGKTALLGAASEAAEAAGALVLRAAGAEFEAGLAYASLNQVLLPLADSTGGLAETHREALRVAFGTHEGPPLDQFVVCNAVLALLRRAATPCPVLVAVDDAQWLDDASAGALGFVGRRLTGTRVGLLAMTRPRAGGALGRARLPAHELGPLASGAARDLLAARWPHLAAGVRTRLVEEAGGNPLALLELPAALTAGQRAGLQVLPPLLPLSERLQSSFTGRLTALPEACRQMLLMAVLEGEGDLDVLQSASGGHSVHDLAPAERAGLVAVRDDTRQVVFSQQLTRSAVMHLSTRHERHRAHLALAAALSGTPERRAWHLAQAATKPDEDVASLLESGVGRLVGRVDPSGAVTRLIRAAELSPQGPDRRRRLTQAAFIAASMAGELADVAGLLARSAATGEDSRPTPQAASTAAFLLLNDDADLDTVHHLLVNAIEACDGYDPADHALTSALFMLAMVCCYGNRGALWRPLRAALARFTPAPPADLALLSAVVPDPARAPADAVAQLDTAVAALWEETDPWRIRTVTLAASGLDRLTACRPTLWRLAHRAREAGAATVAAACLMYLCLDDYATGRWRELETVASECLSWCGSHGLQLYTMQVRYSEAMLAAARGDGQRVQDLTDEMVRWAMPRRACFVIDLAHHARALAALGDGGAEDAYQYLVDITRPGALEAYRRHAPWTCLDFVEAAVRAGHQAEAAAHARGLQRAGLASLSPRLALLANGAAGVAAEDLTVAAGLFERAVGMPGATRWPFDLARVQLAYGERLRRAHAASAGRVQLGSALRTFTLLRAEPWASRARKELRASGYSVTPVAATSAQPLTAREREIATLAAAGLTNKQIGERLFLSHRTVGAHLHRLFPKLGIATRAALRDALAPSTEGSLPGPPASQAT
ncbi:MAG TPA: AAA family ATPase [Streptosporangiaceae bacterium]|nr:AAA family ATPase [Streptosporangiaceae bacterium]